MNVGSHRRMKLVVAGVVALALAVVAFVVGTGRLHAASVDRGDPDPGGHRLASITSLAPQMLPTDATHVTTNVTGFHWGQGGCDGEPAGWVDAEVDQTFTASTRNNAIQQVTARMQDLGWRLSTNSTPAASSESIDPQPIMGPADNFVFEPAKASPYGEYAYLLPAATGGPTRWDLDVATVPAVNPDHSC